MLIYRHRQMGAFVVWLFFCAGLLALVLLLWIGAQSPAHIIVSCVIVFLLLCIFIFSSLTVEVTPEHVKLWFGPGMVRKTFTATDISNASVVRNHWYYGWGIRLTPHGWLFNVSGLDAVEIELRNGRKYRIGTDEPLKLVRAIRQSAGIPDNS